MERRKRVNLGQRPLKKKKTTDFGEKCIQIRETNEEKNNHTTFQNNRKTF